MNVEVFVLTNKQWGIIQFIIALFAITANGIERNKRLGTPFDVL